MKMDREKIKRSLLLLLLLALVGSGCSDDVEEGGHSDAGAKPGPEAGLPNDDKDKDGYTVGQGDCDDNNDKVYPGAKELCTNKIDDNCNGAIDANEPDQDFDGFGPCQGDCDDMDQAVHPLAKEAPDGKDNNCDGITDADYDMDGQKATKDGGTDCDDSDATVYKGAVEDCYDNKDNDCNTYIDGAEPDGDKDGYGPCGGDCDDKDAKINPGAKEIAGDKKDNNCDGMVDVDIDGDGWTTANGDCDDNDAKAYPGAKVDCVGGKDLNCNGVADNTEKSDADGDGVSACGGDCDDYDATSAPGFIEIAGDKADNDCDGKIDNVVTCDCATGINAAQAMDMCDKGVTVTSGGDSQSQSTRKGSFGAISVRQGCSHYMLSTGKAWSTSVQTGSVFTTNGNPVTQTGCFKCTIPGANKWVHPGPKGCCEDKTEFDTSYLTIQATAPVNAKGLRFDFLFLSAEYPEFIKKNYNDTFYAVVSTTSLSQTQNVSFDKSGQPLTVNNSWFENPNSPTQSLVGTGFGQVGSSSGWLTTLVPVKPNAKVLITFWIHDEGDRIYDSAVIIDNLRWTSTTALTPSTVK